MKRHIINKVLGDKDHYRCECGWEGETKHIAEHMVKSQFVINARDEKSVQ